MLVIMVNMKNGSKDVTWAEIEILAKSLSEKLNSLPKDFSTISTISRGGLIPARMLADHMGIETIFVDKDTISSDSLFVDDIYDSGNTFKKIISKVSDPSDFVYATFFARRGKTYPKQLIYAKKTDDAKYLVFPWDRLEYMRLSNSKP